MDFYSNQRGYFINGPVMKSYVEYTLIICNSQFSKGEKVCLKLPAGWMQNFKKRFCLKLKRIPVEALKTYYRAIKEHVPSFDRIMATFHRDVIWNADEFGLFYHQPCNWSLCSKNS